MYKALQVQGRIQQFLKGGVVHYRSNLEHQWCHCGRRVTAPTSLRNVAETTRHFPTRVRKHLVIDRASHIYKHLQNSEHCRALCSVECFHILDHASTGFQLKIKEAFHIHRQQPSLNQQYIM